MTFSLGDRIVIRDFRTQELRRGTIVEVYKTLPSGDRRTMPMYAVAWEDTKRTERGYLGIGFELEPLSIGGLGL